MLRVGDELITLIDPDAPASEAYRTLRTNILMRNFDRDMKVINIISTTAQEGKTTRVLNLAMVYAQLQKKVLVIDLDLRMPTIHKKLKLKNKKGISDIIGHQADFEEVVLQPYENVDVFQPVAPEVVRGVVHKHILKDILQFFLCKRADQSLLHLRIHVGENFRRRFFGDQAEKDDHAFLWELFQQFRQVHAVHLVEFFFDLSVFFRVQKLSDVFYRHTLPSFKFVLQVRKA